jgi:hypothetical protein
VWPRGGWSSLPAENEREWLRNSTTCHVIPSRGFLDTFLPPLKSDAVILTKKTLQSEKLLNKDGWLKLGKGKARRTMKERKIFNKPLKDIVNMIFKHVHKGNIWPLLCHESSCSEQTPVACTPYSDICRRFSS